MQLMNSATTGHRVTATLSTLTAIALLGAAVTAEHAGEPGPERLQSLASDLRYQLEMVYRAEPAVARQRLAALDATLDAWQRGRQSERDDRALAGWMRESILRSMPADRRELPPTPEFGLADVPLSTSTAVAERHAKEPPGPPKIIVAITPPVDIRDSEAAAQAVQAANAARQSPALEAPARQAAPPTEVAVAPKPSSTPAPIHEAPGEAPTLAQSAGVYTVEPVETEHSVAKPVAEPPALGPPAPPASEPVQVNLAELNARIRGYHAGLDEIEAALEARRQGLTESTATELVGELEQLAAQRQFIVLYYDGLTPRERARVATPRELVPTIKLAEKSISAIPSNDGADDFLASVASDLGVQSLLRRLRAAAETSR